MFNSWFSVSFTAGHLGVMQNGKDPRKQKLGLEIGRMITSLGKNLGPQIPNSSSYSQRFPLPNSSKLPNPQENLNERGSGPECQTGLKVRASTEI